MSQETVELEIYIRHVDKHLSEMKTKLNKLKSEEFIKENFITLDQIETRTRGLPLFANVYSLGRWLINNSGDKKWVLIEGGLYSVEEIKKGYMPDKAPCNFYSIK